MSRRGRPTLGDVLLELIPVIFGLLVALVWSAAFGILNRP
jgi:hypothetical protein